MTVSYFFRKKINKKIHIKKCMSKGLPFGNETLDLYDLLSYTYQLSRAYSIDIKV